MSNSKYTCHHPWFSKPMPVKDDRVYDPEVECRGFEPIDQVIHVDDDGFVSCKARRVCISCRHASTVGGRNWVSE